MKEFLSRNGKSFKLRVVDEDPAAFDDLLALGYRSVPVTVIGAHIVKGYDAEGLTKALEAAG